MWLAEPVWTWLVSRKPNRALCRVGGRVSWRRGRATLPSLNIKDCPYSISLREGRAATPQSGGVEQEETCPSLDSFASGPGSVPGVGNGWKL